MLLVAACENWDFFVQYVGRDIRGAIWKEWLQKLYPCLKSVSFLPGYVEMFEHIDVGVLVEASYILEFSPLPGFWKPYVVCDVDDVYALKLRWGLNGYD